MNERRGIGSRGLKVSRSKLGGALFRSIGLEVVIGGKLFWKNLSHFPRISQVGPCENHLSQEGVCSYILRDFCLVVTA